ncbi:hypothetical protein M426DRAFT_325662 [Hypoxylon sp. CI-4A]|nr:hypothetical protein M426DRAFT_325662 [Hypoxylon sp. CI-4A]
MGIFNQKSKLKRAPQEIRVEKVVVPNKARPSLTPNGPRASSSQYSASPRLSPNPRLSRPKSASPYPSSADEKRAGGRKRKIISSTPRDSTPAFGNDSESEDEDSDPFRKRLRRSEERSVDLNRKLRHKKAFGDDVRDSRIIHAADIASVATKCPPIQGAKPEEVAIELQYPSHCKRER